MVHKNSLSIPALAMEDYLGIVYVIETAQQFWSELEDIIRIPNEDAPTLSFLDSTLRRFLTLCATYHEQYLQSPLQLQHAFDLLFDSELFQFHSERMCDNVVAGVRETTDPHTLFILYNTLYFHGCRRVEALRNQKRWQPVIPLLMDHILVEIDPDAEDTFFGAAGSRNSIMPGNVPVPIEVKLRSLGVKLLYEVCKVQKMTAHDLRIFDDSFIDFLFDLVEQTKYMQDDAFNYSVIKLLVALNEQFMVAGLGNDSNPEESTNRVIRLLIRRFGMSQTFGENLIFILNRAKHTPEDLCTQLLILKLIYVLFTTKGLAEYFYTNDLCVLVDVFLRELANLDDHHESLRHTYLRVLHPLLTKTQLRNTPYKRPQIMALLESLINHTGIRDVNSTTKRLVERCLSGDWCVQLKANQPQNPPGSPHSDTSSLFSPPTHFSLVTLARMNNDLDANSNRLRNLKFSKSVENLSAARLDTSRAPPIPRSPLDQVRHPNASTVSLSAVPVSLSSSSTSSSSTAKRRSPPIPQRRSTTSVSDRDTASISQFSSASGSTTGSSSTSSTSISGQFGITAGCPVPLVNSAHHGQGEYRLHAVNPTLQEASLDMDHGPGVGSVPRTMRRPPPAPPKRRKPPAIPTGSDVTMYPIKSSEPSPLSKVMRLGL